MTIIINGFHTPQYFPLIDEILATFKPKSCHIIYQHDKVKIPADINTYYYSCESLSHNIDYKIDDTTTPLCEPLIQSMADCEATCLKMLDRDELYSKLSYNKRREIYLQHLRYWNHVIETNNVKAFVASNIPHVVYDYIIHELCQKKRINIIILIQFQKKFSTIVSDWKNPTPGIRDKIKEKSINNSPKNLAPRIYQEWELQTQGGDTTPFYIDLFKQNYNINKIHILPLAKQLLLKQLIKLWNSPLSQLKKVTSLDSIKEFCIIKWTNYLRHKTEIISNEDYEKRCTPPSLEKKYIYIPLHSQPELSTSPMAGVFVDQLVLVQLIAHSTPDDVYCYVKEHPTQFLHKRDKSFYDSLQAIHNVKLVSRNYPSVDLIKNCIAIGTCVGTAGWEGLFKGKPTLLFGNTFFQDAPGIFQIRTIDQCKQAIERILSQESIFSQQMLIDYLARLNDYIIFADIDPMYTEGQEYDWNSNIETLRTALRNFINR